MGDIQFKCTNILEYNAATGQYVQCGELLQAPPNEAGMKLQCTKCEQWVEIPFASTVRQESNISGEINAPATSPTPTRAAQKNAAQKNVAMEATPITDTMSHYDHDFAVNSAQQLGQQNSGLQFDSFNMAARCPLCGHLVNKLNQCTNCEFGHQREATPQQIPLKHMKVKAAGFSHSFCQRLSDNISIKQLVYMSHTAFGVMFCAAALAAVMIGGPAGIVAIFLALPFVAMYLYMTSVWVKQNTAPAVPLAFWQKPIWNLVKRSLRGKNWNRRPDSILDCRQQAIDDQQVRVLPNISNVSVLDLEGTQVTDAGLISIQGLKNLRYIVLTNTRVTSEGVFRLQQELPRAWIWSG